jgi:hypothetical protein
MDDREIAYRFPVGSGYFSVFHSFQTGSGDCPDSYAMKTGGPFAGGLEQPGRKAIIQVVASIAEVKNA